MPFNQLHFAHPTWLWSLVAIPLIWILFLFYRRIKQPMRQLEQFIDSHLLPYLLVKKTSDQANSWKRLLLWSAVWGALTIALAGPRWNMREIEAFSQDQSLVILLDLSESMNVKDVKPSRLIRAKQKIEDLLDLSNGTRVGLVAFAADPHMLSPITDDKEMIRRLLPSIDTNLVYIQGSRLSSALEMASKMLQAEPGSNKAVLVISDGGFEDAGAIIAARKLAEKGIQIHAMGMGTLEGGLLYGDDANGQKNPYSKLEKDRLNEISKAGRGHYMDGSYAEQESIVLTELGKHASTQASGKKHVLWDEYFYLMLLPVMPIILLWFRKGHLFAAIAILCSFACRLEANSNLYFKNSEERGKQAFDDGNYQDAVDSFQDSYRKGVSCYRAGNFSEAEKMFRESNRKEVAAHAAYNLGNALVQQQKLQEAVKAYEDVLEQWPDHVKAKENLEIVKKMLEEQEKNPQSESENSDKQDQSQDDSESKSEETEQKEDQEKADSEDGESENSEESEKTESSDEKEQNQQDEQQKNNEESDKEQQQNTNSKPEIIEEQPQQPEQQPEQQPGQQAKKQQSQEDQDADMWLNQIENDPQTFLKNKFYLESRGNGTKEGIDPW